MRQLLALVVISSLAARLVEVSYWTPRPIGIFTPGAIAAFAACALSVLYLLRKEA